MTFEDLKVIDPILDALEDKGYKHPTPIQEKAIPIVLDRQDLIGCAQTGTGKTAAFSIPIIQLIQRIETKEQGKPTLRALILTPTRELAIQIDQNIKEYSKYTNIRHTVIFGGVKQGKQVARLKQGVHILVATPGRLLDLCNQGHINLDTIKLFVLDEADRMLDMGFIHDIRKLLKLLPTKRQTLFFSATMPDDIVKLSRSILNQPKRVDVAPVSSAAETVKQYLFYTNRMTKRSLLIHILEEEEIEQVLVFGRTKHGADKIARYLKKEGVSADAIHGNKSQVQRQKTLNNFKAGKTRVLVATDIAARGIDIQELGHVINYDIPNVAETYVHRIGRVGRAGLSGVAISLCEPEENAHIRDIEKLINNKIKVIQDHPFPQTDKPMTAAEKKEWNKEKQRRKQEFFKNRKKGQGSRR
ncbi:MAG: DEAD/DEAH box helicase [Saprospiraceae bacterium]